jgi:hypothetical protein
LYLQNLIHGSRKTVGQGRIISAAKQPVGAGSFQQQNSQSGQDHFSSKTASRGRIISAAGS